MPAPEKPTPAPRRLRTPEKWARSLTISALGLEPKVDWAGGSRQTWQPGEAVAAKQMKAFVAGPVASLSTERDRPDHRGTSRLSPHLHFGEISVRQMWHAARLAESYLRQIAWREFSYHLLFHFPRTPQEPLRPQFRSYPWRMDAKRLAAWTRGQTGYPLVDAGRRELRHTGWMHNRVRMLAASFLVKHLLIPWQEGAAWFWDTLVDADLANNTMGWQWSAGCGADAAPYLPHFHSRDPGREVRSGWRLRAPLGSGVGTTSEPVDSQAVGGSRAAAWENLSTAHRRPRFRAQTRACRSGKNKNVRVLFTSRTPFQFGRLSSALSRLFSRLGLRPPGRDCPLHVRRSVSLSLSIHEERLRLDRWCLVSSFVSSFILRKPQWL
jgi:hypothetical protein